MKKILTLVFATLIFLLASCSKEKSATLASGHVIVVNEGGFHHSDASVSVYDPATKSIVNDVFGSQNGFALGDVAQCAYLIGDTAYIVMNASKEIVIADASHNFKFIGHVPMPTASPRYFLPVSASKAYVTELYAHKIWIVDYRTGTITGNIPVSGWTEQLIPYNGKVYVLEQTAPSETPVHKLRLIDPISDQIVQSLDLATDPGSMVLSDDHKLYVLSSRQSAPALPASLYQIDPASLTVLRKLDFDTSQRPAYLRYSSFTHQLLYAMNGIYTMAQADTVLPSRPLISESSWNVYGLNADPGNGDIYISDAIDYQQASRILRYSRGGAQIDAFNAGIITNAFLFR